MLCSATNKLRVLSYIALCISVIVPVLQHYFVKLLSFCLLLSQVYLDLVLDRFIYI